MDAALHTALSSLMCLPASVGYAYVFPSYRRAVWVDSGCCQALRVWPVSSVELSLDWRTMDSASELDLAWR